MNPAVFALAVLAFVIGTTELVVAGLLPNIAATFQVPIGSAGLLVTTYAAVYAVGAPVLVAATASIERRRLLLLSTAIFLISNIVAATSTSFLWLLLVRAVVALSCSVGIVVSIAMAAAIVPESRRGRAIGLIFAGIVGSLVLGVPIGTLAGGIWGWRVVFVAISIAGLVVVLVLRALLPELRQPAPPPLLRQLRSIGTPASLGAHGAILLQMAGQFAVYTFIVPILASGAHLPLQTISVMLLLYGIGGIIGAWLGGWFTDQFSAVTTFLSFLPLHALCLLLLPAGMASLATLVPLVMLWCVFNMAPGPAIQKFLVDADPALASVQIGVNTSAIQAGVALGSLVGGTIFDAHSPGTNAYVGGTLILLAALSGVVAARRQRVVPEAERVSAPG